MRIIFIILLITHPLLLCADYPFYKYFLGPSLSNPMKSSNYLCARGPTNYSFQPQKSYFKRANLIPLPENNVQDSEKLEKKLDKKHKKNVKKANSPQEDLKIEAETPPIINIASPIILSPQQQLIHAIRGDNYGGNLKSIIPFNLPFQDTTTIQLPFKSLYERK